MGRTTVAVAGHRIGVTEAGDGRPLVLLHGIGRDREDWRGVQPLLARHRRTIALDVEGFGQSAPWGAGVTLGTMARMVREAMTALGAEGAAVVGNSMGGAVALRLAADDPAALSALVLISPAGFGREASFGLRLLTVPGLGGALLALDASPAAERLRRMLPPDAVFGELAAASSRRLRSAARRRAYLQVVHDLGAWGGIRAEWRQEVLDSLAAAGLPAMVLWGDRDTVLPHAHLAAVAPAVPHARAVPLPGLGHMPQLEDPERIAALIEGFLDEVDGAPAPAPSAELFAD